VPKPPRAAIPRKHAHKSTDVARVTGFEPRPLSKPRRFVHPLRTAMLHIYIRHPRCQVGMHRGQAPGPFTGKVPAFAEAHARSQDEMP
jgi:hypothetical protein